MDLGRMDLGQIWLVALSLSTALGGSYGLFHVVMGFKGKPLERCVLTNMGFSPMQRSWYGVGVIIGAYGCLLLTAAEMKRW